MDTTIRERGRLFSSFMFVFFLTDNVLEAILGENSKARTKHELLYATVSLRTGSLSMHLKQEVSSLELRS